MSPTAHPESRAKLAGPCLLVGAMLAVALCQSCARRPEPQLARVTLPPLFSDNMVLQQGVPNTIWGWGPPNRPMWARYKQITATGRATRAGTWELQLDLSSRAVGPFPDYLLIGVGKPGESIAAVLTNVVVGNVWLVGGGDGCGVPMQPRDGLVWQPERIRFLTLKELPAHRGATCAETAGWLPCGRASLAKAELSALTFDVAFGLGEGFIGVIQTSTNSLLPGLLQPGFIPQSGDRERLDQVRLGLQEAYVMASNQVSRVVQWQQKVISELREKGMVTNFPSVKPYGYPVASMRNQFSPALPPASVLAFEGAIG